MFMALTEAEKKKIEEEEEYRAKIRSEKSVSEKKKTHPVTGCLAVLIVIFIVVSVIFGIFASGNTSTNTSQSDPQDYSASIGKHAYNKINGVYRGEILKVKPCATTPELMCFVVNQPTFMRPIEAPVDNSVVKDEAPTPSVQP
jgi:hypothetical protein